MTEAVRRTRKAQATLAGVSVLGALGAATALGVTTHTTSGSSVSDHGNRQGARAAGQQRVWQGGDDSERGDDGQRQFVPPQQGNQSGGQLLQAQPAPHAQTSGS